MPEFKLSTEKLNSHGFYVPTKGIDLSRYKNNPVITVNHNKMALSVGKMTNIRVVNNELLGTPEWDMDDPIGVQLSNKYEKGYMNGFSVGIHPTKWSEDKADLKKGQRVPTPVESELIEVAATTIPSNADAVRLYNDNIEIVNLNAGGNDFLPAFTKKNKMKLVILSLGLGEDATEAEVLKAISTKTDADAEKIKALELKLEEQETAEKTAKKASFEILLSNPKKALSEAQKTSYRAIAELNHDEAVKLVNLTNDVTNLSQVPEKKDAVDLKRKEWTFSDWSKKDSKGLLNMKDNTPDVFTALFKAEYGTEPKL